MIWFFDALFYLIIYGGAGGSPLLAAVYFFRVVRHGFSAKVG